MKKIAIISFITSTLILAYLSRLNQESVNTYPELKEDSFSQKKIGKNEYLSNYSKEEVYTIEECNIIEHQGNCVKCESKIFNN